MDDRDLEARLRTHLHRRFDGAQLPPELVAAVQQVIATPPRRIGLPQLRARTFRPGWSLVAAALGVALIAIAGLRFGGLIGPGSNPTPSPTVAAPTERQFIILPPSAALPSKTESDLAGTVLADRLRALGFGNFSSSAGYGLEFVVPVEGPSDDTVRAVLAATGDVEFVPLPAEDYGEGGAFTAEVGDPLPKDEPALFGWDGIASVGASTDEQARPTLLITLKPAARDAFATYTETHVGEYFAIVVDGEVAVLPVINEPIPGGEIMISGGGPGNDPIDRFERAAAILIGGRLPESWAQPYVPAVMHEDQVVAATLAEEPSGALVSAELDAIPDGPRWRAVWIIVLEGQWPAECPDTEPAPTCSTARTQTLTLDAETGNVMEREMSDVTG